MLFPIGDDNQGRLTTPYIVYIIIAINAMVFLFLQQAMSTQQGNTSHSGYSVVPVEITTGLDLTEPIVLTNAPPVRDERTGRLQRPVIP